MWPPRIAGRVWAALATTASVRVRSWLLGVTSGPRVLYAVYSGLPLGIYEAGGLLECEELLDREELAVGFWWWVASLTLGPAPGHHARKFVLTTME